MAEKHPFRFGLNAFHSPTRAQWRDLARKVEDTGFSTLNVGDHLWIGLAPLVSMMAAAEATTTLRVGSFVLGNDFRHPAILAREAASIDVLTEGRMEFGFGTGWQRNDYTGPGIPFDPPGVRVGRFEEAVTIIKGLFSGEPVNFAGKYYTISNLTCSPKPFQNPHPPIMIGGGSKRMLSIAAREADIVSINITTTREGGFDFASTSMKATEQKIRWVREAAGENFDRLELNTLILNLVVTNHPRQAAETIMDRWNIDQSLFSLDDFLASPNTLIGSEDEIVEKLVSNRERLGISYISLGGEENIDMYAPIVARLAGK